MQACAFNMHGGHKTAVTGNCKLLHMYSNDKWRIPDSHLDKMFPLRPFFCHSWEIPTLHSDWIGYCLDATGPLCEHEYANSAMLACLLVSPEARKLKKMDFSTYSQTDTRKKLHVKVIVLLGHLLGDTV